MRTMDCSPYKIIPVQYLPNENSEIPGTSGKYKFGFIGETVLTSSMSIENEITALRFDPYQELLWGGSSLGKVQSYFGPELNNYTSFTVCNTPIRALEIGVEGIVVLGKDSVTGFKRQGVMLFDYENQHFEDLTCISSLLVAPNSLLVGGRQSKIIQFDVVTQKEQRLVYLKNSDCLLIRSDDRYIFNSDSNGTLTMRSIDSIEPIHSVSAHTGGISDFDVCGNRVITCGYTIKNGSPFCDPFLKVYDIRNLKTLLPYSTLFPPVLCRFANSFSDGRIIVASKFGYVIAADLNEPQTNVLYQCCNRTLPTCMDVSTSRQCAAVGDDNSSLLLFSDREDAVYNTESWPTIFPSVEECLPPMPIDNLNSTLACVPTPLPPVNGYCSDDWPEYSLKRQHRVPKPISPDLIDTTRSAHSVFYTKNNKTKNAFCGLNVCPYVLNDDEISHNLAETPTVEYSLGN